MKKLIALVFAAALPIVSANAGEYLVKVKPNYQSANSIKSILPMGTEVRDLSFQGWMKVELPKTMTKSMAFVALNRISGVEYVQPNYKIKLIHDFRVTDPNMIAKLKTAAPMPGNPPADNPAIPGPVKGGTGADPEFKNQWGMIDNGVENAWQKTRGNRDVVVAVIDTGVDYTHPDLVENMWRNAGEMGTDSSGKDKSSNGVDDDKNGYVDDVMGWDFVSNDNKPFDLAVGLFDMLFGGGNPGHGTHCAGNVAARGNNGIGIAGVAPNVQIMPLRFISEKGQGTTDAAIAAVKYAVDNGARITSNSWGSEGEEAGDPANQALRDIITYSEQKGVLFIAAAGNGHQGVGYDNDTDAKPGYPASYDHDIIISVAALDSSDKLGSFSNWGQRSVDIGAPGVKVYSTTVGGTYNDTVINMPELGIVATWDGTSMATPHVAGAAALYWSAYPNKNWKEVKSAIMGSAAKISGLKVVSGGKLDVEALLK